MLYSNRALDAQEIELDFGTIHQFHMGERGRGRKLLTITTTPDIPTITEGINNAISIGVTKSGKPKIIKQDTGAFMLLSSAGGYTRRGSGYIQVPSSWVEGTDYRLISRGNGADGIAGRVGSWDCVLLQILISNGVVFVQRSGKRYGIPEDYYIFQGSQVTHVSGEHMEDYLDTHEDFPMPEAWTCL